jgi:hypothetical protein
MARLGRGQPGYRTGHSTLGAPQVVDPVQTYGPVGVHLANQVPIRTDARAAHSELRPPTVVAPVVVYRPVQVSLTEPHRPAPTHSVLRPPTVVGPVQVYGPVAVTRVRSHRPAPTNNSKLRPPTVVAPAGGVFPGPRVELARAQPGDPRRQARSGLGRSLVITAAVQQLGGVASSLVDPRSARPDGRRQPHSRLAPPQVVTTTGFTAAPVRSTLAKSHRPSATHSRLAAPTVVGPVVLYRAVQVALAKVRQARPTGHSRLTPPTVVGFTNYTVSVSLTAPHRPAATHSKLQAPTVVGPVQVYDPVDVRLAKVRQARPLGRWRLAPPTVIVTAGPTDDTVDVTLAPSRDVQRRLGKSKLSAPTVVGPVVVYPPVATTLAPQPRQARAPKSRLQPPTVVTQAFVARAPHIQLAPSNRLARRTHTNLRAPTVVAPVQLAAPIASQLAPQPRQSRGPHSKLRPPAVVGAAVVFRPIKTTLSGRTRLEMSRHASHFRLRPPQVVTDISFIEPFDQPTPTGRTSSSATHSDYDFPTPTGRSTSRPTSGAFDIPVPIGETDIPDPEV